MIYGTKRFVKRHPRIIAVVAVFCWFAAPFFAVESATAWHYAINVNNRVPVPPEVGAMALAVHSALRQPWFFVGYAVWAAVALLTVEYLALRKPKQADGPPTV